MRILVIGGTGFIGKHIVRRMASAGHAVAIFHRGRTTAELPQQVHEILDPLSVMPIEQFPKELFEFEPDVVVHTIAMGGNDARAVIEAFADKAGRLVMLSSGDVYRAYGRFTGIDPGPIEEGLLTEESPLRTVLFPYRRKANSPAALEFWYEKILAEQAAMENKALPSIVLRLPKVYGPGGNEDLATVYRYRDHPTWRWTHGYVENVAAAVELAATCNVARNRVYNVGEEYTPTVTERLAWMPHSALALDSGNKSNFAQNIAYDTGRIRRELGYREVIPEQEAVLKTLQGNG